MSFFNYTTKEIVLKIVYYGPGLCGKTTNVKHIFSATKDDTRGKLISLETQQERTLYFDFLPIELPTIRGFKTRLHLYTVPGQLFYANSRRLIMKGADGVVFVADSQAERLEANLISMDDLLDNLSAYGFDVEKIPFVIQYNKRDLPNALPVEVLRSELNQWYPKVPDFEATASTGEGVFECLKEVTKMILSDLKKSK